MKCIALLSFCILAASAQYYATCNFRGGAANPGLSGVANFYQASPSDNVTVEIIASGVTNNGTMHGIHVHQFGDLSDVTGAIANTGGHYNPTAVTHSCPPNVSRHNGDMGNWEVDANGMINQTKTLDLLTLSGPNSIIGRAVVIHANPDDCVNPTTGNAGGRLASCVIGVRNWANNNVTGNPAANHGAYCRVFPTTGNMVTGEVWFTAGPNGTTVIGRFWNITGIHGFHVHMYGDLNDAGTASGGHYNPTGALHGIPPFTPRHVGDMGNIWFYDNGVAYYKYTNEMISLTGDQSIIGRTVAVHGSYDICVNPAGNPNATTYGRIGQCVVGLQNNASNPVPSTLPVIDSTQNSTACDIVYPPPATTANNNNNNTAATSMAGGATSNGSPAGTMQDSGAMVFTPLFVWMALALALFSM